MQIHSYHKPRKVTLPGDGYHIREDEYVDWGQALRRQLIAANFASCDFILTGNNPHMTNKVIGISTFADDNNDVPDITYNIKISADGIVWHNPPSGAITGSLNSAPAGDMHILQFYSPYIKLHVSVNVAGGYFTVVSG